jgi:hypothetical protein
MFSREHHVGRLYEVRVVSPVTAADVATFQAAQRALESIDEARIVCTDCRGIEVLSPETAERLLDSLRSHGRGLLRNGVLVEARKAVVALQLERMLRQARHPGRQLFRRKEDLVAWLDEILDPSEQARLRTFLDRPGAPLD